MPKEVSGSAREQEAVSTSVARSPLTDRQISQIDQNNASSKSKRKKLESSETRKSELATLVMDHWEDDGSENKCFGVLVDADMLPDKIIHCLLRIETDYELDLVASLQSGDLSSDDVGDFLSQEIEVQTAEDAVALEKHNTREVAAARDVARQERDDVLSEEAAYLERVTQLRSSGKSNAEIIALLINDEATPASERTKLEAIQTTLEQLTRIGGNPKARQFISQAVSQQKIDFTASAPKQIYASLLTQLDTGQASGVITDSDVDAARVIMGVPPKRKAEAYKIPSNASEMALDLRNRREVKTEIPKIDPATGNPMLDAQGNVIYETITEENNDPIPIDHPNLKIYLRPEPNSNAYYVHILSQSRLPLVEKINADSLAMGGMTEINYLVANADLEQQGFADMFGPQFTSNEVRRRNYERFMDATGMEPGFGGLWTTEHSDRISKMMQVIHPRGDLGRSEVDIQNWKQWTAEAGLYDIQSDQWDYDSLRNWRNYGLSNFQATPPFTSI